MTGVLLLALAWGAHADAFFRIDIPELPLDVALERLSGITNLQLLYPSETVAGLRSRAVAGEYGAEAALSALLAGTGLVYRLTSEGAALIERGTQDVRTIGALRVAGTPSRAPRSPAGSSDPLATEGTAYAPRGAGVASRYPQSLKDTPRAVNVIGLPQLRDQNINELSDALRRLPSVAAEGYRAESLSVSVRGRPLEFYQLDGGPERPFLGERSFGDLSAYDRIELLQGADGLGNAFASPTGTLNLVRKRPLDHAQYVVEAQGGSWAYWRGMVDANATPLWNGRLRGRAVFNVIDREYFYDDGRMRREAFYGVAEADLAPGTVLRAGGQYLDQAGTPWETGGLPRYEDGEPVPLPRSRSFQPDWNRDRSRQRNVFAVVEQSLGPRWSARLSAELHREDRMAVITELFGAVERETGDGLLAVSVLDETENEYRLTDLRVNGRFDLWGREQIVSLGLSHAEHELHEAYPDELNFLSTLTFVNLDDDPDDFPRPVYGREGLEDIVNRRDRRDGGSIALTLSPLEPLRLIAAWRWSEWSTRMRVDPQAVIRDLPPVRSRTDRGLSYVGATWALDTQWNLYASWADAFILNDELLTPAGDNPEPTVGDNFEAGLKYARADAALQARLTLYRSQRSNFPRYLPADGNDDGVATAYCCYDNATDDRDRIQGVEAELVGAPWPRWQLSAAYTYADLYYRYAETPVDLPSVNDMRGASFDRFTPRHALRLWTVWTPAFGRGLRFGAGLRTQSRSIVRLFEEPAIPTFPGGPQFQDAYAVVDAMAGWRFHPNWDAALHARNLFDEKYYQAIRQGQTGVYWAEPRSFALSVRGTFR